MGKQLVNKDGQAVKVVAPPVADGRILVQHVDGGRLEVTDVRDLRSEPTDET